MNTSNLIPFNERTVEEQREIAKKGGIASGEARRRKREIKDSLDILLSKAYTPTTKNEEKIKKDIESMGINPEDIDNQMVMAYAMFVTSVSGSKGAVNAFNSIRDTLGEKPTDKIQGSLTLSYEEALKQVSNTDEY